MEKIFGRSASFYCHGNRRSQKTNGKNGATIQKASERGLQFRNKRYLSVDIIQTMKAKDLYKFTFEFTFKSVRLVLRRKNAL